MDSKTLATLAFLDAFGAEQRLLTYFADLSGPALRYIFHPDLLFSRSLEAGRPQLREMAGKSRANKTNGFRGSLKTLVFEGTSPG